MRLAMLYKPVESVEISPSVVYQDRKRYAVDGYWPSLSNPGDGRYYLAARNNPTGPVLGIINAKTQALEQIVPTVNQAPGSARCSVGNT